MNADDHVDVAGLMARLERLELRISELELHDLQGGVYRNTQGTERSLRDALSWLGHLTPVVQRLYWAIKESSGDFNIPDRHALDMAAEGLDTWQGSHERLHESMDEANARSLGSAQDPMNERRLYASGNGDQWSLCCDSASGQVVVRHRPNVSSGGRVSDVAIGEFLGQEGLGPEKQELLRLIGTLVDSEMDDPRRLQHPE